MFGPLYLHIPNLYTIRGDKIRSALGFVRSVERVMGLRPELLITGHGDPIRGAERIAADLTRLRDAVLYVHDETVAGMNAGKDVHTLMREIRLPEHLALGEGHGKVSWDVRSVWEEYAGWFHYDTTTALYDVPPSAVAGDLVELAGGVGPLAARAAEHLRAGRPLEALRLLDVVDGAGARDEEATVVKLRALRELLDRSGGENLSEVMWLTAEITDAEQLLPDADPCSGG
jgi:alkyl sulfatase BDS1-like metallo-beta-lactamase superfamily hydrolase